MQHESGGKCTISHQHSILLSANVTLPANKSTGESDVSAAVMEIKMSVICSCRASGERHKQSAERGRAKLLSVCLEGADNSRRLKLIQPGPTRPDPKQDAR